MTRLSLILAALIASASAASAVPSSWFRATNGMWVQPAPETPRKFYVPWKGDPGPAAFFCAAGDYVIRRLGMPQSTRIFRLSEPPRRAGEGIWFSLDPEGAASRTGVTILLSPGPSNSLSAAASKSFCDLTFYR
jgi:hypothetical protein